MDRANFLLQYILSRAQVQTEHLDASSAVMSANEAWNMIEEASQEENEDVDAVSRERVPMGFHLGSHDEPEPDDDEDRDQAVKKKSG